MDLVVDVVARDVLGGSDSGVLLILTVACPGDVVGESLLGGRLSSSTPLSAGLLLPGGLGLPVVSLFLFAVLPRTVNTLANLVCGRLMPARIKLTSTDVGDLLCHFIRLLPPMGVVVLATVAFWIGCGLLALRVEIPMVDVIGVGRCNSTSSRVPVMKKMTSMGHRRIFCRIVGMHRGAYAPVSNWLFTFAVSCWCLNGYFELHLNQKFLYRLGYAFLIVGTAGMIVGSLVF
jgi:hypothetical protein